MTENTRIVYHEAIRSELDRAMQSIASQTVKIRQIVTKISSILLKLDCLPPEKSKCPNQRIYHFKINDAIYHMTNIVEKYERIQKEIFEQSELDVADTFEEFLVLSTRRIDYLKMIGRRLSAVAENISRIYTEMADDDSDSDEESSCNSSVISKVVDD